MSTREEMTKRADSLRVALICAWVILLGGCTYHVTLKEVKVEQTQDNQLLITFKTDTDMFKLAEERNHLTRLCLWAAKQGKLPDINIWREPYTNAQSVAFFDPDNHHLTDLKLLNVSAEEFIYCCLVPLKDGLWGPTGFIGYNLTKPGNYRLYFWIWGGGVVLYNPVESNIVVVDFIVSEKQEKDNEREHNHK